MSKVGAACPGCQWIHEEELLIIDPERFQDGRNGPCHDPVQRKRFWTDVLRSLELSYETLFDEARRANARIKDILPEEFLPDLEDRIEKLRSGSMPQADL